MSLLTYLARAQIRDEVRTVEGKLLSRPALLKADGSDLSYAVNVEISTDPADLAMDAGASGATTDQVIADIASRVLYNVPIASGNRELVHADVNQPVTLTRSASGTFEVTALAKKAPGTRTRIPVHLGTIADGSGNTAEPPTIGDAYDATLSIHYLTISEMGDPQFAPDGWGSLPLGSYVMYRGSSQVATNGDASGVAAPGGGGSSPSTAPTILAFGAGTNPIAEGGSASLSWSVFGARSVTIDQGIGAVDASGSRLVSPTSTTTYVLTATGGGATVTASVTVTVGTAT